MNGLQPDGSHALLPQLLARRGYRTIHVGKAHFGGKDTAGADPVKLGFEINIAGSHAGSPWGGWISPGSASTTPSTPSSKIVRQGSI